MNQRQCAPTLIGQIARRGDCVLSDTPIASARNPARAQSWARSRRVCRSQVSVSPVEMPRPPVERIELQRGLKQRVGLTAFTQFAQNDDFQISRAEIVGVEAQRTIEMLQGRRPILPRAIHLRQRVIAGRQPRPDSTSPCRMQRKLRRRGRDTAGTGRDCNTPRRRRDSGCGASAARWRCGNVFRPRRIRRAADARGPSALLQRAVERIAAQRLAPVRRGQRVAWRYCSRCRPVMKSSSALAMSAGAGGSVAGGGTSPFTRGLG